MKENSNMTDTDAPRWIGNLSYQTRDKVRRFGLFLILAIMAAVIVFPLYWMIHTSLLPADRMYNVDAPLIPLNPTLSNYVELFTKTGFITYLVNSIIMGTGVIVTTTVMATLGGYGLTRIDIPYKTAFARGILLGYMFPPILLAIPMYIFWRQIGLLNSYPGAILAITATSLPFSLWLMWQFFQTVPESLEESAQMAGAERFRAFYEIALPLAKPGIIAVGTFSYAVAWNAYTIPKVVLPQQEFWVLTLGVENLVISNQILWPLVMAASAITILPALLFVYTLQKYLLRGFRTGGVK